MARKPKWRVSARVESYKTVTVSAETLDEALALATDRLRNKGHEPLGGMQFERLPDTPSPPFRPRGSVN